MHVIFLFCGWKLVAGNDGKFSPDSHGKWSADGFPNPLNPLQVEACGSNRTSTICDPDNILVPDERIQIQTADNVLQTHVVGCGVIPMGIAIVGYMKQSTLEYAQSMAMHLRDKNHWALGSEACDNGILLLVAVYDRRLYFSTGNALQSSLPQAELELIISNMKPLLKDKKYGDAIELGITQIIRVLEGHSYVNDWGLDDILANLFVWGSLVFIGASAIYQCFADRRKNQRYDRCQHVLTRIEEEHALALANQFKTFEGSCPICLELFETSGNSMDEVEDSKESNQPLVSAQQQEAPPGCILLRCGHGFHQACLLEWEEQRTGNCPVCRTELQPSTETTTAERRRPLSSSDTFWQRDRLFRLQRVQSYYPEYVNDNMLARAAQNRSITLSTDTSFLHQAPAYQRELARAQQGASATNIGSFGSGASTGGGGAGGSW